MLCDNIYNMTSNSSSYLGYRSFPEHTATANPTPTNSASLLIALTPSFLEVAHRQRGF